MPVTELKQSDDCRNAVSTAPSHRVQFYKEEEFLLASVTEHLANSLVCGGTGLAIVTAPHRDQIFERLYAAAIPAGAIESRCRIVDASDCLARFMRRGVPDRQLFFSTVGDLLGPSLRDQNSVQAGIAAFGEMVAVLWLEGKREAAIQLEQLWEEFTGRNPVSLLCAYPLAYFSRSEDQEFFARVCAHHTSVIPAESFLSGTAEEELAREVAGLQQRAEALAREVEARKRAEAHLRATNAEVEAMVRQRTETLRKLSLQIIKLQEVERRRVARELHESVGQDFAGLKMNLDLARRSPQDPKLWENCDRLLEHCINKVRTLSNLLHPPLIEDAGLPSAAEWYVQDFARRTGLEVSAYGLQALIALSDSASIVAFRALQEFLINA